MKGPEGVGGRRRERENYAEKGENPPLAYVKAGGTLPNIDGRPTTTHGCEWQQNILN